MQLRDHFAVLGQRYTLACGSNLATKADNCVFA